MDKPNRVETVQRACKIFISGMFFLLVPLITLAENASLAFGGKDVAADAPIEITSESLEVNQSDGTVVFSGDVLITQGALRRRLFLKRRDLRFPPMQSTEPKEKTYLK